MIKIKPEQVSRDFLERIPRDFAREYLLVSQGVISGTDDGTACSTERLITSPEVDPIILHNMGVRLGRAILTEVCDDDELIARVIDDAYTQHARESGGRSASANDDGHASGMDSGELFDDSVDRLLEQADREILSTGGKGPIVRLIDQLLFESLGERASDLHIQPLANRTIVRYRIDGALHDRHELSPRMTAAVVSRIKVMGRMDIAERRIPQDGRSSVTIAGRPVDLRISTIPTSYGERVVIRLLDHSQQLCNFDQLGMPDDVAQSFADRAIRSNGIILVTGPTGSGKTTTLYSTLRRIATPEKNVMTIEDPIEYELSGFGAAISQAQVNAKKGITFITGLRHILRQDPDVIMIGEIRDLETARMAIQSSLTGHLVFSTLHTNDAPSAVTRLIDLGVEPYLVGASLSVVLAQRLVRRIHQVCAGHGCDACHGTGLFGRCGLYELMQINEELREAISHQVSLSVIRAMAGQNGMRSLREEGLHLVERGITTRIEVERVVDALL